MTVDVIDLVPIVALAYLVRRTWRGRKLAAWRDWLGLSPHREWLAWRIATLACERMTIPSYYTHYGEAAFRRTVASEVGQMMVLAIRGGASGDDSDFFADAVVARWHDLNPPDPFGSDKIRQSSFDLTNVVARDAARRYFEIVHGGEI